LGQALQLDPRLLGIFLQKNLTLLDLSIFWYFLCKKKKLTHGVCFCFFSFLSLLLWIARCNPHSKSLCLWCIFFFYSFLILNFFCLIIRLSWHGSKVWWFNPVDSDFFLFFFIIFFLPVGIFFFAFSFLINLFLKKICSLILNLFSI
jgi:hypothetical protein